MNQREIKFRAWDKTNSIWLDPAKFRFRATGELIIASKPTIVYEINQFTGLKDKHWNEIYEGDIVSYPSRRIAAKKKDVECGFIEYRPEDLMYWIYLKRDKRSFTGTTNLYYGSTVVGEVIGNIYENPELLKP